MKFKSFLVIGLAVLGTSAVALAISRAVIQKMERPSEAQAIELLAMLEPTSIGVNESEPVQPDSNAAFAAPIAQQSFRTAVASTPKVKTILTELDRTVALRASVAETASTYIVTIGNDVVPPEYASHLNHVANVAHAEVRYNTLSSTYVFPMTQIGTMWVTSVPKNLGFLPTHSVSLGAWEAGSSLSQEQDSVYWYTLTFE